MTIIEELRENLYQDWLDAIRDQHIAQDNFDYADQEDFDIVNRELTIANLKLETCYLKLKKMDMEIEQIHIRPARIQGSRLVVEDTGL